ncbi:Holliday junction resolvase RuvX [Candidatus Peregrinibacteria bacterium]|nr:Holliday junction resolvase RuvX [Candidatus Peregrinibacteria bacterium]
MPDTGKVLGIDYGDANIGIAVSDINQDIAFPKITIKNISLYDLIAQIKNLCDDLGVVEIVVGMPVSMSGLKSPQTIKTEKFISELKKMLQIPVYSHDERLTTKEVHVIFASLDVTGTKEKRIKDEIAASLILKNYLDLKRNKGKKGEARGAIK